MRVSLLTIASLFFASIASSNASASVLYGITFGNQLITINPINGAGSLVGNLSSPMAAFGLGVRGSQLYTFDQTLDRIHELSPATGATINTFNIGIGDLVGEGALDFRSSDGIGYLSSTSGFTGQLFSFDITGPSSTPITGNGLLVPSMDGMAFNNSNVLYGINHGGSQLFTINQSTGATSLVGNTGLTTTFALGGLDFDSNGDLFAALSVSGGSASTLYKLNPNNGAATLVGNIGFNGISGLAFLDQTQVVPEPTSIAIFSLLWVGIAACGRTRRHV